MLRTHPMVPDGEQRASTLAPLVTGGERASGLHGGFWKAGPDIRHYFEIVNNVFLACGFFLHLIFLFPQVFSWKHMCTSDSAYNCPEVGCDSVKD